MAVHFSDEAVAFLRGLVRHNERAWFEARRAVYETEVKAPMHGLIGEINDGLAGFAPEHVRPAQKAMMRIYRDIRFSKNKAPYKTQVAAWWAREGMEKTSGAGFYLSFGAAGVTVAAGVYRPEKAQLLAIRRHLVEHHEAFRKLVEAKKMKAAFAEFEGLRLKRAPKGFGDGEVPKGARDLVLCQQWGVAAELPVAVALGPGLRGEVVKRFRLAAPLVALLNEPLVGKARRPIF